MAIETVAQTAQSSFADPQNGNSPIDADEVTANDNALREKHNTHDADPTIHVQGSALGSRPAAGVAGRKWMTRDAGSLRIFRDTGVAWEEISYVPTSTNATIDGILTFDTAPAFPNAQTFGDDVDVDGNLDVAGDTTLAAVDCTTIAASGNATVGGTLGVTGASTLAAVSATSVTATGAVSGATLAGDGAAITALAAANITPGGTLPALNGSALTALNASNVASGTLSAARLPATASFTDLTATNLIGQQDAIFSNDVNAHSFSSNNGDAGVLGMGSSDTALVSHVRVPAGVNWVITGSAPTTFRSIFLILEFNGEQFVVEAKSLVAGTEPAYP